MLWDDASVHKPQSDILMFDIYLGLFDDMFPKQWKWSGKVLIQRGIIEEVGSLVALEIVAVKDILVFNHIERLHDLCGISCEFCPFGNICNFLDWKTLQTVLIDQILSTKVHDELIYSRIKDYLRVLKEPVYILEEQSNRDIEALFSDADVTRLELELRRCHKWDVELAVLFAIDCLQVRQEISQPSSRTLHPK
jgi:hypothetical protein